VVAGSGPLLLAVAATLKERDANVIAIVEQTLLHQLTRFALSLLATPGKLRQALQLGSQLKHTPYYMNSYVLEAQGKTGLEKVVLQRGAQPQPELIDCDYLACGFGLIPNIELAIALGCASAEGVVQVDRWQQTSVHGVFCAGESTGIGGVDLSLVEGRIAGLAAVNDLSQASIDIIERERWQRFARRLTNTFVLRPELRDVCDDSTIVCRCEDVCHGELAQHTSWRSAKLHTRCGMGPCQGRVCSGATDFLYGWSQDSVRMPLSPARIDSILSVECANDAL
ncbi:FAD-dependent oxidoreductase, partial [Glaciimonas sp. GG7]